MFLFRVFPDLLLELFGGAADAKAEAFAESQDCVAEADGELFNFDADPFGGQEVAELMEEDDESESEDECGDGENIGQSHKAVPSSGASRRTLQSGRCVETHPIGASVRVR
jgi:hypothetical protein